MGQSCHINIQDRNLLENQDPTVSNIQVKRNFSDDHDIRRTNIHSILDKNFALNCVRKPRSNCNIQEKRTFRMIIIYEGQTFTPFWITLLYMQIYSQPTNLICIFYLLQSTHQMHQPNENNYTNFSNINARHVKHPSKQPSNLFHHVYLHILFFIFLLFFLHISLTTLTMTLTQS